MAIRQYIGARYVPKFVGRWNANTAYEPLSIVQDANGNSFTSKKQVPAGTALNNTEYWYQSSNFNAQIEELDERIREADAAIDALEEINTPITAYYGTNMIVFGDSNTVYPQVESTLRWPQRVAQILGANLINYGVSNSTWQTIPDHPTISTQINNADADSTAKLVCVMGGINDFHYGDYSPENFAAAITATLPLIHNKFPNALIVSLFDAGSQMPDGNMLAYARTMMRRASGSQSTIWNFNTLVIPTVDMSLVPGLFINQNHYDITGHAMIARRILSALYGNGTSYAVGFRDTRKSFTQAEPTSTGWYNCNYHVKTIIDPVACTRQDVADIGIAASFANTDSSKTSIAAGEVIFDNIPILIENATNQTTYAYMPGVIPGSTNTNLLPVTLNRAVTAAPLTDDPVVTLKNRYAAPLADFGGYSRNYRISTIN